MFPGTDGAQLEFARELTCEWFISRRPRELIQNLIEKLSGCLARERQRRDAFGMRPRDQQRHEPVGERIRFS